MNRSLVLRRLCWKELRLLLPLVLMLAVIGLVFQLLLLLSEPDQTHLTRNVFFLGMPGLFAAGVGALLVGQEKESRTLYWMASLPIFKQDIIRVKFLAGLAGLAAVWLISFVFLIVRNGVSSNWNQFILVDDPDLLYGILYSVFVLVVSFATAWSFRSTFVGLLVLVGIATLYTVATNILVGSIPSDTLVAFSLIVGSGIGLTLGWFAALRSLSPMPPPRVSTVALPVASAFDRSIVDRRGIQSPASALIWQFGAQNRTMLLGLAILFLVSLFTVVIGVTDKSMEILPAVAMPAAFISVCWLGVISFQGDNIGNRIRFLSDRGISPKSVWLTRHAILIGMLTASVPVVACVALTCFYLQPNVSPTGKWQLLSIVSLVWACSAWTIYSVSQWISQVLPSPIIAAIVAPIVGCLPFAYGAYAFNTLESPIWILAIVTLIPWIATFRMTRLWMDGRMGKRFWLEHTSWLFLFVLLPALPFLCVYLTYPSMPASEWKEFSSNMKGFHSTTWPEELKLLTSKEPLILSGNDAEEIAEEVGLGGEAMGSAGGMGSAANEDETIEPNTLPDGLTMAEERKLQFQFIERQLDSTSNIPLTPNVVGTRLMSEATLARARIQDEGPDDDLISRYKVSMQLMTRYIAGVRVNPTLRAQQSADEYEAWLLREVQADTAMKLMDPEVRLAAVSQLTNKSARNKARNRALVVDWGRTQADISGRQRTVSVPAHTLGGFEIPTVRSGTRLISSRHVSTVAWHMKQYLNASDDHARVQARRVLERDWNLSETDPNTPRTPSIFRGGPFTPWTYWHADWELQADALKTSPQ
jgi:hypothetical protein